MVLGKRVRGQEIGLRIVGEYFPVDLSEVEPAVLLGEVYYRVHLFIYEGSIVGDDGESDDGEGFAVLGLDLGDGKIEP